MEINKKTITKIIVVIKDNMMLGIQNKIINNYMQFKKIQYIKYMRILVISLFLFLFVVSPIYAAELSFKTQKVLVGVGQDIEVTIFVDSADETINALEGIIQLPSSFSVKEIRRGNSLIAFWAEKPAIRTDNTISFTGIIPGGWKGSDGELFSFVIETTVEGVETLTFYDDTRILLHNYDATEPETNLNDLTIYVDESVPLSDLVSDIYDNNPPESFKIHLTRNEEIFGGDYFLVFTAQDKGSGIDHYEVKETRDVIDNLAGEKWETVQSPYRINDQTLKSFIYIRAVDKAGNIRVEMFKAQHKISSTVMQFWIKILIAFLVILVIMILIILLNKYSSIHCFFWKNNSKQN